MPFAKIKVNPPGPAARKVIETLKSNCYDSTFTYPLVISNGFGCVLTDPDGNEFLDFTSNIGSCPLGYSHPAIMEVLSQYSKSGAHKIAGQDFYCEEHARISERLLSILPKGFKAFFVNSGAEAVENAIKIAWRKMSETTPSTLPGISCLKAFHGRTLGALSCTFSKPVQKKHYPEFPMLRIRFCTTDSDADIDAIEAVLAKQKAAFILTEVIQGEGGYNFASHRFVKNLRNAADRHSVPLIIDEVQSGLGRTGKWWAFEHYNISPDVMTSAKALQVGAAAYESSLEPKESGALSSTWGGGARIDLAVGAQIIDTIIQDKLLQNSTDMGTRLRKGLAELADTGGQSIAEVRGIGLMIGVEFGSKATRDEMIAKLFSKGLLVLPAGDKAMRMIPPLVISKEEVDEGIQIFHDCV